MNPLDAIRIADRICGVTNDLGRFLDEEDRIARRQEALEQAEEEILSALREHGEFGYGSLVISREDVDHNLGERLYSLQVTRGKTGLGFRADFKAACERAFDAELLAIAEANAAALLAERAKP